MKKVFALMLIGVIAIMALTGCAPAEVEEDDRAEKGFRTLCDFRLLGELDDFGGNQHQLYYDATTGVIYMRTYDYKVDSYTPLLNTDGTPKIWRENSD